MLFISFLNDFLSFITSLCFHLKKFMLELSFINFDKMINYIVSIYFLYFNLFKKVSRLKSEYFHK